MTSVGYATLQIIPSMRGVEQNLAAAVGGPAAAAGTTAGGRFTSGFATALKVGAVAVGAATAVGVGLYKIGGIFDDVTDTIRTGTGAQGAALDGLVDTARRVGTQVPAEFGKIGTTVADLNTRLGLTGPTLERVASQYLEAGRILGQDVDIQSTSAAFSVFKIEGDAVSGALDHLFRVSQATGVGMNELAKTVQTAGPITQNLGFSFEETSALVGTLDKAGIDANRTVAGLSRGLVSLAQDGEEPAAAFRRVTAEMQDLIGRGETAAALDLAGTIFGTRGAAQFIGAVQSGKLELDDLVSSAGMSSDTILQVGQDTADLAEHWQRFKNNALVTVEPVASRVFGALSDGMAFLNDTGIPAMRTFAGEVADRLGPGLATAGEWATGTLVPALQTLGGFITGTLVPGVSSLVTWMRENETTMRVVATVVGAVLLPVFLNLAVQSARSAATQVAAWVTTKRQAVSSAAAQFAAHYRVVAGWAVSAAAAVRSGAQTVAIWTLYKVEAAKSAAATVAAHGRMAAAWVVSRAQAVASATASAAAWVASSARTVAALVAQNAAMIGQRAVMVAGAAATGIVTAAQWAWNAALSANPIGIVVVAIAALVAALVYAWNNSETFRNIVMGAWEGIKAAAEAVAGWFTTTIPAVWDNITTWTSDAWNGILDFFKGIPKRITDFFMNFTLPGLLIKNWDRIKTTAQTKWNQLVDFVRGIPGRFISGLAAIGTTVRSRVSGWVTNIRTAAQERFTAMVNWVRDVPGRLVSALAAIGTRVRSSVSSAVGRVRTAAQDRFTALVDWVRGIPGRIVSALGNLGRLLLNAGRQIIGGLLDGITQRFEGVKNFVGGIGSWIANNKGPREYDLALLVPAGGWIMEGLQTGIARSLPELRATLGRVADTIRDTPFEPADLLNAGRAHARIAAPSEEDLAAARRAAAGSGMPRELVVVDTDGKLVGRMRVEAARELDDRGRAVRYAGRD